MIRFSFNICLLLLCIVLKGNAQQAWTIYNSSNSPLPENSIRCIAIAPGGDVWVGTDYGLASFDGTNWNVYLTTNSGLPDNAIRSIAADSSGNIWIGTFSSGLVKYDGTNWVNYTTFNSDIPDDYVRSIAIDTMGNKWLGTVGGLAYFDDSTWEIYDMSNTQLLSNNIGALYVDTNDNTAFCGTINGGMAVIENPAWTFYTIWNSNIPDNSILGLDQDTSGNIWLATPASGLAVYTGGSLFLTLNTSSSAIQSNSLSAISISDITNNVWTTSIDSGLIRRTTQAFDVFNTNNSPMPDNHAQAVKVAPDGIIWVGTQTGGLVRIDETLFTSFEPVAQETLPVSAYPSPASTVLHVNPRTENVSLVEVYDMNGKKIPVQYSSSHASELAVDVMKLNSGIYLLKVISNDGRYGSTRFVKR